MDNKTKAGYIAIVGKPNAGKSTLMNSILGTKLSIVTPKPQTTRKQVLGIHSDDTTQIVFLDTPGILNPKYEMQRLMMDYVNSALEASDAIIFILDVKKYKNDLDEQSVAFLELAKQTGKPILALLNKIDLYDDVKAVLPSIQKYSEMGYFQEIIPMSALKATHISDLIATLSKYIPENEFYFDPEELSTQNERFFVSEIIREQIFMSFAQEIPYSTEIEITQFREKQSKKWFISADVIVERKSQKIILVGAGGERIKHIGEKARAAIEEHLQQSVYLELFVKVRDNWRNNKGMLKNLGY